MGVPGAYAGSQWSLASFTVPQVIISGHYRSKLVSVIIQIDQNFSNYWGKNSNEKFQFYSLKYFYVYLERKMSHTPRNTGKYLRLQMAIVNKYLFQECACICAFGNHNSIHAVCMDGSYHKYSFSPGNQIIYLEINNIKGSVCEKQTVLTASYTLVSLKLRNQFLSGVFASCRISGREFLV